MLTLSFGGTQFFDTFRAPTRARPQRSERASASSGGSVWQAPDPGGPRRRLSSLFTRLPWRTTGDIAVTCGSGSRLQPFSESAARPAATVDERPDELVLWLQTPGARPANTEVIWDAETCRLVVGVWSGPRPGGRRHVARPELAWYRSHWLPRCAGGAARVTVNRGRIDIRVPWRSGGALSTRHRPDSESPAARALAERA